MYVRLAAAWADRAGTRHDPGDLVDIDLVTLAELEEQGVVDNAETKEKVRPAVIEDDPNWHGPGDDPVASDDTDAPDADSEEEEQ